METLFVGISGINAVDNPGPGIGVARSLKEDKDLNVRIVGLAYDAMEPGIYMDWIVDKSYLMPYPSSSGDSYLERLLHIQIQLRPGPRDPEPRQRAAVLHQVRRAAHRSRASAPSCRASPSSASAARTSCSDLAAELDIRLPKTEVVTSDAMLADAVEAIGLPVMVKGCFYKAHFARTLAEATAHYSRPGGRMGIPGDRAGSDRRRRTERGRPGRRRGRLPGPGGDQEDLDHLPGQDVDRRDGQEPADARCRREVRPLPPLAGPVRVGMHGRRRTRST